MRKRICKCGKIIEDNRTCSCKETSGRSERNTYMKSYRENNRELTSSISSRRWAKKRNYIIKRDGSVCQRCLIKYNIVNAEELQVHHIKPRTKYHELMYEDSNLICICGSCNRQLGTREELDFQWKPIENNFTL